MDRWTDKQTIECTLQMEQVQFKRLKDLWMDEHMDAFGWLDLSKILILNPLYTIRKQPAIGKNKKVHVKRTLVTQDKNCEM